MEPFEKALKTAVVAGGERVARLEAANQKIRAVEAFLERSTLQPFWIAFEGFDLGFAMDRSGMRFMYDEPDSGLFKRRPVLETKADTRLEIADCLPEFLGFVERKIRALVR